MERKGSDAGRAFKVKVIGFTAGLDLEHEKKRRNRDNF